jgi:hypothetical protein
MAFPSQEPLTILSESMKSREQIGELWVSFMIGLHALSNRKMSPFLHPSMRKIFELGMLLLILIERISASNMSTEVMGEQFALLY